MTPRAQEKSTSKWNRKPNRLLTFDTSAAHCAAVLLADGQIVAQRIDEMARGQAEHLMGMLEEVLDEQGLGWRDLDALGVGVGPGNFTGIRISVSAARGVALGMGIQAIGVSMFEAAQHGVGDGAHLVCLPAPRDTLYVQLFEAGKAAGSPRQVSCHAAELHPAERAATAVGPGTKHLHGHPNVAEHPSTALDLIRAKARLAEARFLADAGRFAAPAPLYVRSADAAPPRDPAPVILPG